jgi:hypothetical protein
MRPLADYLCIPTNYLLRLSLHSLTGPGLADLRWSPTGEAIEYKDGTTFALSTELALFLEGFATSGRLIAFAYLIHFVHLLRPGTRQLSDDLAVLSYAYIKTGRLRNAGALAARLCTEVPGMDEPIDAELLCSQLSSAALMGEMCACRGLRRHAWQLGTPPLGPGAFEAKVREAVRGLRRDEVEHWMRHGRGPLKKAAEHIAKEIAEARLRTLSGMLATLARRPRFAAATPLVPHLTSALSLPPRSLAANRLPVGGYADVTTRGNAERLLPSQFALDDMDFLRRFAEHELLYFRREEPQARNEEELVVLLDQGVRTWGDVRLALSASVLALGKMASRRKIAFRLAGTASGGQLIDPLAINDEALGKVMDASDLSPHPGLALEAVLEGPATAARDVVLLSHPRSVSEPDVAAAARRLQRGTRLFAVAVDDRGRVDFSQIEHGAPVCLSRFRVDFSRARQLPTDHGKARPLLQAGRPDDWRGDIERVGFPFRFGVGSRLLAFDFDHAGEWILTASQRGLLHASKLDGSRMEVLPRGMVDGTVVTQVNTVRGVAGGFVVAGRIIGPTLGRRLVAVHYDFVSRVCTVHVLCKATQGWQWYYYRDLHAIAAICKGIVSPRNEDYCQGVDLTSGAVWHGQRGDNEAQSRAAEACARAQLEPAPPPHVHVVQDLTTGWPGGRCLHLDRKTGAIQVRGFEPAWEPFVPLADGNPMLQAHWAINAQWRGRTLAIRSFRSDDPNLKLHLFGGPTGTLIREYNLNAPPYGFQLSADGNLLARQSGACQLEVCDVAAGGPPLLVTVKGQAHDRLNVELCKWWLAAEIGNFRHVIRWEECRLTHELIQLKKRLFSSQDTVVISKSRAATATKHLPELVSYDPKRFIAVARSEVVVVVDSYGHLAVLDNAGQLVCMFFIARGQFAAWMPDGTRYGPVSLTGAQPTPDAAEKIGKALREAAVRGRKRQP